VEQNTTFVAFDTSKETIAVALAEAGRRGEVRFFGTIANRPEAVHRLVDKLAERHSRLAFFYEAGPTGIKRLFGSTSTAQGLAQMVA
jgi:transposase